MPVVMDVDNFDFELPDRLIALRPVMPRDHARLLYVDAEGALYDHHIFDLPMLLRKGDVLISNNTKVLAARLRAKRRRGAHSAQIELTLTIPTDAGHWQCMLRPAKRVRAGDILEFENGTHAHVVARDGATVELDFGDDPQLIDALLRECGQMPLPPYIAAQRAPDSRDICDYQTLFARHAGAIAAPTAGLHFTRDLLDALTARGIICHEIPLHVGGGTFLPVKVNKIAEHVMHTEHGVLTRATADLLNAARAHGRRLIAIGTTSARLLESAVDDAGVFAPFSGETDIFITPGYRFRAIDMLLTNFHLPRSTLLMLVAAFAGLDVVRAAYGHAIDDAYRFYSYGDACLFAGGRK